MDVLKTRRPRTRRGLLWAIAGALAIAAVSFGLSRLRRAAPVVDRSTVVIDTVRRGEMLRQIRGQGSLVPTDIRWITAETPARVERVLVAAGDQVTPDTVLIELSNPDVELRTLEAERELAQARAHMAELDAALDNQRLAQAAQVATLEGELADASRRARANVQLHEQGAMSELEKDEALGRAEVLGSRVTFEKKRLSAVARSRSAQIEAQNAQIDRLQDLVAFGRRQVANLAVKAGSAGVVQELPLQPGQMVVAGALLAKVVDPSRLKAELRVPESQMEDVALGMAAVIDTRTAEIPGRVVRIDPAASGGTVRIDVALDGALPAGARPDLNVDGVIHIERLANVLHVRRPSFGEASSQISLFKLLSGGSEAVRVPVQIGKTSVATVEIVSGLQEGDSVILSDLTQLDSVDRIRLQ